jgi:ABC-type phosphate transport system ATPase subunit
MYLGEVIEQGDAKEVLENPKMEKTKHYLGGTFN